MVTISIPKDLPDCAFFTILASKVEERHDITFDFFGSLESFRKRVSGEVQYINQLFPEYTPHDEHYHLKRLFYVADTLLGKERIETLNSAELFILAISLYGHDWGMAVSEAEKQYICTGTLPDGITKDELWILPDERARVSKFIREQRLTKDGNPFEDIKLWREYVRQTHAFRSAERVRRFFEKLDGGVAEAGERACVGHWLDFEALEDHQSYPADLPVLRESVNLRAVTIYLRLIDLLDIAEDRTPYVFWKFVAPRDPRSKMEWAKHRALRPITCPSYQEGRSIRVDGSTDDHEVYAALQDLRVYCEQQLRRSNDVLARMNDPRHMLDLYHVDWRVGARGFQPVSIQFEFDRAKMFEILSDQIYQGDPYVFLRELLQNSIDAIRMRREVLERRGVSPGNLGTILVDVEHRENGDAIVTWRDDGIGMDEYVVRNYLAVAGKSYYRSPDFEREGLRMDPISRFGVGILSCFMVADRVEIETFKDPYLPPPGNPLAIRIPAVQRQFRIEALAQENRSYGTIVRVFVEGKKLLGRERDKEFQKLDVTGYLSVIAGFVEFPIVITEGSRKTVVLHPKNSPDTARERFGSEFQVHQIDLNYPWSRGIVPQDVPTARQFLREDNLDLSFDLGLQDYEGVLSYLVPANDEMDFYVGADRWAVVGPDDDSNGDRVRWNTKSMAISNSGQRSVWSGIYKDGILVPGAGVSLGSHYTGSPSRPLILINLKRSSATKLDLARMQILAGKSHWEVPFWEAYLQHLSKSNKNVLLGLKPRDRFYHLSRLFAFQQLSYIARERLTEILPLENWSVPCLDPGGQLSYIEWRDLKSDIVFECPDKMESEVTELLIAEWSRGKTYNGYLQRWSGSRCIVKETDSNRGTVRAMCMIASYLLSREHSWGAIRFLQSPRGEGILSQRIWLPRGMSQESLATEHVLEKAAEFPADVNSREAEWLLENLGAPEREFGIEIKEFWPPFDRAFLYGGEVLNIRHRVTQSFLQCLARFELLKRKSAMTDIEQGQFEDALTSVAGGSFGRAPKASVVSLKHFWLIATRLKLFDSGQLENVLPEPDEILSGKWLDPRRDPGGQIVSFGQPIT
ncbi:MAG TPA: ATP-binding protein [Pyrinomonadaceae bacterium]|nr:ATP-binding protein [Pyrinomonadaceae bacterium]